MRKKYPRTPHLTFSPGATSDDKVLKSHSHFAGRDVVISIKMDGEISNLYRDGHHAKSLDSPHHPSRDWLARYHSEIAYRIPVGWRICGENLYARHSLEYTDLPSYFLGFSVWNERNVALSWDNTVEFFDEMGIHSVKVLYRGLFDEALVRRLAAELDLSIDEGLVIRLADEFAYEDFGTSVAKWVRPDHVTTDAHWMHQAVTPNKLGRQS